MSMGNHGEDPRAWWLYGSVFQLDILWKWSHLENHPSVGFYYAKKNCSLLQARVKEM